MAGNTLLQVLLVAVVFGSKGILAQNNSPRQPVLFFNHRQPETFQINRFGNQPTFLPQPSQPQQLPPVRVRNTPSCAESNDITNKDRPCIQDGDYNNHIRNLINKLLLQTPGVNEIVSDPMLKVILEDPLTPVDSFQPATRFGGARESPVCVSQEELIFPQRAKTSKNDWVFVLNQDNVKQALRVERCANEGQSCRFGGVASSEITTVCRQKYVYRRMLTLGTNNIQPEEVLMPSCCVCYFRRETSDIGIRIRNSSSNAQPTVINGQTAPISSPISFGNTGSLRTSNLPPNNQGVPQGIPQGARTSPIHRRQGGTVTIVNRRRNTRNPGNPYLTHGLRYQ